MENPDPPGDAQRCPNLKEKKTATAGGGGGKTRDVDGGGKSRA